MSSFLNKGKRQEKLEIDKKLEKTRDQFHKTLLAMNYVFTEMKNMTGVTEENFEEVVKTLTAWRFSQQQLDILKRDYFQQDREQDAEDDA